MPCPYFHSCFYFWNIFYEKLSPKKKAKDNVDPRKHVAASLHTSVLLVFPSTPKRNRNRKVGIIQKGEVKFVNGCAVAVNHRQTERKKIMKVGVFQTNWISTF